MRMGPQEVRLAVLVGAVGALAFVLEGLLRWQFEGDSAFIKFPVIVAVLELVAVGGLIARFRAARLTTAFFFGLVGLIHLLALLNMGPLWVRVVSGVLSAAHVFGIVLLNTRPARLHFRGDR
jgi:hypothetical protein